MYNTDSVTVMVKKDMPSPDWMGLKGPVVVALSNFMHNAYRPREIIYVRKVAEALANAGIEPGSGRNSADLPEEKTAAVMAELQETIPQEDLHLARTVARNMYQLTHANLKIFPCPTNAPDITADRKKIRRLTKIKRLHVLAYNEEVEAFTVPDIVDRDYGCPFYLATDQVYRVNLSAVAQVKGREFAELLDWRRHVQREAFSILHRNDVLCTSNTVLGEPKYAAKSYSRIREGFVMDRLLSEQRDAIVKNPESGRRMPQTVEDLQDDETIDFDTEYNRVFTEVITQGVPVPRNQFLTMSGEPYAGFEVNERFRASTVLSTKNVHPRLMLFSVPTQTMDRIVFNGDALPWE